MSTNMSADVPVYKRVLRRCTQQLVEELDFDSITDYLISREVFPSVRLRDIKEERYTSEKIRALLEKIENTGLEAYKIFLDGLIDKSVQQKHLRKLLLEEEKKIKQEKEDKGEKRSAKKAVQSATPEITESKVPDFGNLNSNTSQQYKDIPTQNTSQTGIQYMPEPCKKGKNVTDSIEPVNYQSSDQKPSDMHEAGKNVTNSIEPENYQFSGQKPSDMHEAGKNVTDCHTDKHTDDLVKNIQEEQASDGATSLSGPLPSLVGNFSSYQDMHENSNIEKESGFAKETQQGHNTDPLEATEGQDHSYNVPDNETLIGNPRKEDKGTIRDMGGDQETRPDNPKSDVVSLKLNTKRVNYDTGKFPQPTLPIGFQKTDDDNVSDDEKVSTMTSDMSALCTKDEHEYLSEHFDACVIATEKNRNRAEEIISFVGNLRGGFKICYYNDEEHFGLFNSTTHPEVIFKHCFLHLIIISDDLDNKEFAKYIHDTVAMIGKHTARGRTVLFTKEEEIYKKGYMANMKDILWYDMDKDYRKTDLIKLLAKCKEYRKKQEEKELKTRFNTTP